MASYALSGQIVKRQFSGRVGAAGLGADVNFAAVLAVHLGLGVGRLGHGFLAVLEGPTHVCVLSGCHRRLDFTQHRRTVAGFLSW